MPFLNNKKFTLFHLVLFSLVLILVTFSITDFWLTKNSTNVLANKTSSYSCKYDIKRMNGLKYIKPLMFVDDECESDNFEGIKQRIVEIINRYKANEGVTDASVYFREFESDDWMAVNEDVKYKPGSLFKVPVLITILKMNEDNPNFINKVVKYDKPFVIEKKVAYTSKTIQVGKSYTIKELLSYMIEYSDNNATVLLESNMNGEVFRKLFDLIGLKVPNLTDKEYLISPNEYSLFMRAIYNASYLTIKDSEYAAELLTHCNFKEGIMKGLPSGTIVAHKFGESGNLVEKQLHESAIVYLNSNPYLITVMTKGKDNNKLSQLIAEISQAVYLDLANGSTSTM